MRLDKFLNVVNIVKRRAIAEEMCREGVIYLNGKPAKGGKRVKVGDVIEIRYLSGAKKFQVLKLPEQKTLPKSEKWNYIRQLG
ncbi:MAG: RNA-binding S4 domain-containing protein [Campylobacterales bacterium]